MTRRLRIAVAGASGRMGQMLIEAVARARPAARRRARRRRQRRRSARIADVPRPAAADVSSQPTCAPAWRNAQVLIDFTRPEGTLAHLAVCRELGVNAVIGTTGFSDAQKAEIAAHARAHRDRDGAQHERRRQRRASSCSTWPRAALADGYDIEIVETHHRHKVDAPERHRAEDGRGGGRGARPRPEGLRGLRAAKA